MNHGLRITASFSLAILIFLIGGAAIRHAQANDTDTVDVGLTVTWECPFATRTAADAVAISVESDQPTSGPGSCPKVTPTVEVTPTPGGETPTPATTTPIPTPTPTSTVEVNPTPAITTPTPSPVASCPNRPGSARTSDVASAFAAIGTCPPKPIDPRGVVTPPARVVVPSVPVVDQLPETGSMQSQQNPTYLVSTLAMLSVVSIAVGLRLKKSEK